MAVPVVEHLLKTNRYNLIVVLVRKNQLVSALLILAAHKGTPDIVFMVSNPSGWVDMVKAVGPERLILGFEGTGGMRIGHVVRYVVVSRLLQPTTFDELDGSKCARLKEIMQIFSRAGSSTASTPKMDAWQKTHVAWISPLENAMYKVDCDNHLLARSPDVVRLAIQLYAKGLTYCTAWAYQQPQPSCECGSGFLKAYWRVRSCCGVGTNHFKTAAVEHTAAAIDEMSQFADAFTCWPYPHRLRHQPLMSCAHSSLHHIRPAHMLDDWTCFPGRQKWAGRERIKSCLQADFKHVLSIF